MNNRSEEPKCECVYGYYMDTALYKCQKCSKNCLECETGDKCLKCAEEHKCENSECKSCVIDIKTSKVKTKKGCKT